MTNEYYNDLNSYLFSLVTKDEIIKTSMWGENSQFIRLNNSKVRQTGIVNDLSYSIALISNKRLSNFTSNKTLPVKSKLFRIKSIIRYRLLCPPPRLLEVMRP